MRRRPAFLAALLLAGACATREPSPPAPGSTTLPFGVQHLELTLDDYRFDPSDVTLVAGTRLVLMARNRAGRVHNVTILDADGRTLVSVDVPPRGEQRIDLTPERPGVYPLYCHELGHRSLGMQGVIRVHTRP